MPDISNDIDTRPWYIRFSSAAYAVLGSLFVMALLCMINAILGEESKKLYNKAYNHVFPGPPMINEMPLDTVEKLLEFPAFKTLQLKNNIICATETSEVETVKTETAEVKITSVKFPQMMQKEINDATQAELFLKTVCKFLKNHDKKQQKELIEQASVVN